MLSPTTTEGAFFFARIGMVTASACCIIRLMTGVVTRVIPMTTPKIFRFMGLMEKLEIYKQKLVDNKILKEDPFCCHFYYIFILRYMKVGGNHHLLILLSKSSNGDIRHIPKYNEKVKAIMGGYYGRYVQSLSPIL
jgi:hypothetical protein